MANDDLTGLARTARLDVLFTGYAADHVAGTVSLIRDAGRVILSHHHPDHTVNIALFGEMPVHDFQAVYHRDSWDERAADGGTPDHLVVLTHLWWTEQGPLDDPFASDPDALRAQRERVLALADLVVPGHGPAFKP